MYYLPSVIMRLSNSLCFHLTVHILRIPKFVLITDLTFGNDKFDFYCTIFFSSFFHQASGSLILFLFSIYILLHLCPLIFFFFK